jgi:hypothetical protein
MRIGEIGREVYAALQLRLMPVPYLVRALHFTSIKAVKSPSPLLSNQTLPTCEVVILYCNGLGQFILLFITNYFSIVMWNRDFTQKELPLIRR